MTPVDLLLYYESQSAIARAAGITQPSVWEWFENGYVPEGRQYQFEVLTKGKLLADRAVPSKSESA